MSTHSIDGGLANVLMRLFLQVSPSVAHTDAWRIGRAGMAVAVLFALLPHLHAQEGLVLHYTFDTNQGTVVSDMSGSGNDATVNGATWVTNGLQGGGYRFNGTNNYLRAADSASLRVQQMTLSVCVKQEKLPSVGAQCTFLSKEMLNAAGGYYLGYENTLNLSTSSICYKLMTGGRQGMGYHYTEGPATLLTQRWHMVTATFDGANRAIYVDGEFNISIYEPMTLYHSSHGLYIGIQNDAVLFPYCGSLDDVRIYNRALSAQEIGLLYTNVLLSSLQPVASFTGSPTNGCIPLQVTFTDTSTGAITNRIWDFNNDVVAEATNPIAPVRYTYSSPGVYSVRLAVSGSGGTDTVTRTNCVTVCASTPYLSVLPASMTVGCTVGENAANRYFEVWNAGIGEVRYQITDNASWMSEWPTSGISTGQQNSVLVRFTTAGLVPGNYNAAITVTDTNAGVGGSPKTIPVSLIVTSSPSVTIVDNGDGLPRVTPVGTWLASTYNPGYYAFNYLHDDNKGKGTKSVTFTPSLAAVADYDVYLWWAATPRRATNVPVDVVHQEGTASVLVNQRLNGSAWNPLGRYHFAEGVGGAVRIRTDGTASGYVTADAVKWVNAGPQDRVPPSVPSNLMATALSGTQIRLMWNPSTDNVGVAGYTVWRDGGAVANVTTPSFTDSGLAPGSAYEYAVEAFDRVGNRSGQSTSLTSRTLVEYVLDNASPEGVTVAGAWTLVTNSWGWQGQYLHDGNALKGNKSVTFRPNLPLGGNYDVSVWYPVVAGTATNVPVDIGYLGWTHTVPVNQRLKGGMWNLLGRYTFGAGSNGFVRIRTDGTTSGYVIADAVRFRASTVFTGGGAAVASADAAGSSVPGTIAAELNADSGPKVGDALLRQSNMSNAGGRTGESGGSGTSDQLAPRQSWVWANGSSSDEYPASHLVDGDTNTLWIGNAAGSPWRVAVDLGQTRELTAIDVLFYGAPWTNFGLVGSADATTWCDLTAPGNWPVPSRYLFLNMWAEPQDTNVPAIREIMWQGN